MRPYYFLSRFSDLLFHSIQGEVKTIIYSSKYIDIHMRLP